MKYYYGNPLAAAWMSYHHDFSYVDPIYYGWTNCGWRVETKTNIDEVSKFYIRPDCLYLLEPQIGDLVLCEIDDFMHPDAEFQMVTYDPQLFNERHGIVRILYRGGVAFHWPESEGE